jgi:hypothetical protein
MWCLSPTTSPHCSAWNWYGSASVEVRTSQYHSEEPFLSVRVVATVMGEHVQFQSVGPAIR